MTGTAAAPRRARTIKAAEDRRRDLLDAGLRVLRARGAEATVAEITEAAGVAKGTFYLYFSSKDDLVRALRHELDAAFVASLTPATILDRPSDWWELADLTVAGFVDFLLDVGDVHDVLYHGPPGASVPADGRPGAVDGIAGFLHRGVDAGVFRVADPEVTAALLFHAIHGAVDVARARGPVDRDRLVAAARDLVHRALGP